MTDLSILTRDAFIKSFRDEVALQTPLFAMFYDHRRVTFEGGKTINQPVIKSTAESLMQWYKKGDPLNGGSKSYLAQPSFNWKKGQLPLVYDVDDEIQNVDAAPENKILDIVELLVRQADQGAKLAMDTALHLVTTGTDSKDPFQSIPDALGHSRLYGGITSGTAATDKYWNGASLAGSYTDLATPLSLSLDAVRRMRSRCMLWRPANSRFYLFLPLGLHSKLIGQVEAAHVKTATGRLAKYGFTSVTLYDNIEVVEDPFMAENSLTTTLFMIDPETWEMRFHPSRAFKVGKFVDQSQIEGGEDKMLARLKVAGNLVCWQPNANMYKSNVS